MTPPEAASSELIDALAAWDYDSYFPADYTLPKGVIFTSDWPFDQLQNIEVFQNGMLTQPVISVVDINLIRTHAGSGATLGNVIGAGAAGSTRYGQTLQIALQIDCWTDEQTGSGDQAKRLGGGVLDCLFVNQNSLPSYRRLMLSGGRLSMVDAARLWRYTLTVWGNLLQTYDS